MSQKTRQKTDKTFSKKDSHPFLFRLTNRAVLYLFLLLCGLILFYIMGNYQNFLDSDQSYTLSLCTGTAIALALFSFFSVIESIYYFFLSTCKSKIYLVYCVLMCCILFVAITVAIATRSVSFLSEGMQLQP